MARELRLPKHVSWSSRLELGADNIHCVTDGRKAGCTLNWKVISSVRLDALTTKREIKFLFVWRKRLMYAQPHSRAVGVQSMVHNWH